MDDELARSYQFCDDLSRRTAKNFYWSFRLLPPERRRSMCALYAFMRRTDDLADEPNPADQKRGELDRWRAELDAALAGQSAAWPGLAALAHTVNRHSVPPAHLHAVIDGVLMDLEPVAYPTFDDLYPYCYRVASAVGLSCIHIWGYESDGGRAEELAEACGIALQLTNIMRDVGQDAREGRVYLPQEDLDRFGVTAKDLGSEQTGNNLRKLLAFEARRAEEYYERSAPLAKLVSRTGRPVLRTISGIYRALLDEIKRRDYDVLPRRVSVPNWKKASIMLRSLAGRPARGEGSARVQDR